MIDIDDLELEAIAESIERGEDPYVVPQELLVEPEEVQPPSPSLYGQIRNMTVGERIKVALRGNREARSILIRDTNRVIQRFVLQNPRITDEEIVAAARNRNLDQELLRRIGEHKYWPRNYQVRLGLVTNPKTPLTVALHFVSSLTDRDIRLLAKSKSVSGTVVAAARRFIMQREKT